MWSEILYVANEEENISYVLPMSYKTAKMSLPKKQANVKEMLSSNMSFYNLKIAVFHPRLTPWYHTPFSF